MQTALRVTTKVMPGGRLEITDTHLSEGTNVDVIVLLPENFELARHSVLDVLRQTPGKLLFKSAEEVDTYIATERNGWTE